MQTKNNLLFIILLCMLMLLTSCGQDGALKESLSNQETQLFKLLDKGEVIHKDGNRWLITSYIEANDGPYIDAYWLTINEQTLLHNIDGDPILSDEMKIGSPVEVWNSGLVAESYPAQSVATKIVKLNEEKPPTGEVITRAEAVQLALQTQTETTMAWGVKDVSLEVENGIWTVTLVKSETIEEPISIHVNAFTGEIVAEDVDADIVSENDAFRVFSPLPKTEVGPAFTFTVEGEARVFEGAYHWTLEDGHVILAEGQGTADEGAPEWGKFQFEVSFEKALQSHMSLILYEYSAKDGSIQHELVIPLRVPEEYVAD